MDERLDMILEEARRSSVRAMRVVAVGIPLLAALLVTAVLYTAGTRNVARNSLDAVTAQLADNERTACVTERRNTQSEALGQITVAANNALAAGLLDGDEALAREHRAQYVYWVAAWHEATLALREEVLNLPPPRGCGPPIDSRSRLEVEEDKQEGS